MARPVSSLKPVNIGTGSTHQPVGGSFLDSHEFAAKLERRRSEIESATPIAADIQGTAASRANASAHVDEHEMSYLEELASRIAARQRHQ